MPFINVDDSRQRREIDTKIIQERTVLPERIRVIPDNSSDFRRFPKRGSNLNPFYRKEPFFVEYKLQPETYFFIKVRRFKVRNMI